jgi:arginyl-tRNA synthetase
MTRLEAYRQAKLEETAALTRATTERHAARAFPVREGYFLPAFAKTLLEAIAPLRLAESPADLDISWLDRARFSADVAVRLPAKLKEMGSKDYVADVVPRLATALSALVGTHGVERVEAVGIYVNISLSQRAFFDSLAIVERLGEDYGWSDRDASRTAIAEYSDPNAAKHLHAGHIRSTIIGHVIANLLERTGTLVHRVNHYNDWGGIGAIMEGYERWKDDIGATGNQLLYETYLRYRTGEKLAGKEALWLETAPETCAEFARAYACENSYEAFRTAFADFKAASHARFMRLENGDDDEFALWEKLIPWSLSEFEEFYRLLGTHIEHPIGESFYADMGRDITDAGVRDGKAVFYTPEHAAADTVRLDAAVARGEVEDKVRDKLAEGINRDIGSYVVPLSDFERFVVLKEDRSTIYATRDLGVVKFRTDFWNPDTVIYEVGQEQADHFDGVFRASRLLGIASERTSFEHVSHGFYVNEKGAKLSSRDGASNIIRLIESAISYFRRKYDDEAEFTTEEKDHIARSLAIGSIIFNDIKKDRKQPVTLGGDELSIMRAFEESGGAYVVYASCRAKSILAKAARMGVEPAPLPMDRTMETEEIAIVKKLHEYPLALERATDGRNPSVLAEYMRSLAQDYNSLYAKYPVLPDNPHRLVIAQAVARTLDNALTTCGMTPLARI